MATRQNQSILVYEMVVGAYIERLSFSYCRRSWRCAIECLGNGWPPLPPLLFIPQRVTLPSSSPNLHFRSTLLFASPRHDSFGAQRLARTNESRHEGKGG